MTTDTTLNNTPMWMIVYDVVAIAVTVFVCLHIYQEEVRFEVAKTLPEIQKLATLHRAIVEQHPVQDLNNLKLERRSEGVYVHETTERLIGGARVYDRTIVTYELCGNTVTEFREYYDHVCETARRILTVAQGEYELEITITLGFAEARPLILTVAGRRYEIESIPYYFRCFANDQMPAWARWFIFAVFSYGECSEGTQPAFQALRSAMETLNTSG